MASERAEVLRAATMGIAYEFADMTDKERRFVLRGLNAAQKHELERRWFGFENDGQREPPGDWRIWLIRAGRGFGKTRAGSEWVSEIARAMPEARIALVAATSAAGVADGAVLRALIEEASELGARRALARLGLADEAARDDIVDLRQLLGAWRDAKTSAWKAAVDWAVRGALVVLVVGLAVKLGLMGLLR